MEQEKDIVNRKIRELALKEDFCRKCEQMGFETIQDIIQVPVKELLEKEGFDYHWLEELTRLLGRYNLLHKLQPLPGNSGR